MAILCLAAPARAGEPTTDDLFFHLPRPRWRHPVPTDLRVDGILWPAGAPPPPDFFITELTIWHAGVLASRGATPAADIELHRGGNQEQLVLATRTTGDRAESAARLSVPLWRDHLWFTAGAATGDSLAVYQGTHASLGPHQLSTFLYVDRYPAPATGPRPAASTTTPLAAVTVGAARWRSRLDEDRLDLTFTASAARITRGVATTGTASAAAGVVRRYHLLGPHSTTAGIERTTADLVAFAEDSWRPTPALTAEIGVRYHHRTRSTHPRAGLVYDWSGEGRSRAVAVVSDRELFTGAEYELVTDLAILAAWHHTADYHGPMLMLRKRGRRELSITYELDRPTGGGSPTSRLLAWGLARFDLGLRDLFAGLHAVRALRDAPPATDSAGIQLGKRFSPTDTLHLSLAADLVATADERTAWLGVHIDL